MAPEVPSSLTNNTNEVENAVEEPQASQIFRIVFFSLITVASLVGNSIMLKAAREYPSPMRLSYLLVTNLAAAELLNTLCAPFSFVFIHLKHWPFGEVACTLTIPLQVLSLFVVTSTLAAIAGYRFLLVVYKLPPNAHSRRRVYLFLAFLWLSAFVVALPLFIFHKPMVVEGVILCSAASLPDRKVYEIVRLVLNFGLPYMIMVLSYAAVAYKIKKHIEQRIPETTEMSEMVETAQKTEVKVADATEIKRGKSCRTIGDLENDLLKMFYVVIITFALCYLPYQTFHLFYLFGLFPRFPELKRYSDIIQQYCLILTYLPSALHPICYGTMSKFYARVFSKLVLCRCNSSE